MDILWKKLIFTARKRSLGQGKVMFLHISVILSTGGWESLSLVPCSFWVVSVQGGLCPGGCLSRVVCVRGVLCPGDSLSRGSLYLWGISVQGFLYRGFLSRRVSVQGVSVQGVPVQRGFLPEGSLSRVVRESRPVQWRADGMHPTGVHSCCIKMFPSISSLWIFSKIQKK